MATVISVRLEVRESTNKKTRCTGGCEDLIFTGEKYTVVIDNATGKMVKGEKYCKRCLETCEDFWANELAEAERFADDGERHLRQMEDYAAYQAAGCTSAYWEDRDAGFCD